MLLERDTSTWGLGFEPVDYLRFRPWPVLIGVNNSALGSGVNGVNAKGEWPKSLPLNAR